VGDAGTVARHRVVLLVYPGFQSLDLAGPFEVFAGANAALGASVYDLTVAAMRSGSVASESGLEVTVRTAVADLAELADTGIGTLVVVGGNGVIAARDDEALVAWVRSAAARSSRIASVCSGTFVLAAAGLLDGVRVTTHWRRAPRLAREHPEIDVDPDPIFIRNDRIWTSAGVTAGIDLALAMVEDDHGAEVAQEVARSLVMFLRRPGGQSQFATAVWSDASEHRPVRAALDLVHSEPSRDLTVPRLAAAAAMSERHFLRVFTREVGCTPAVYVERVRVEAARRLLEESDAGVDVVATRSGFGTAETMRRAFVRRLGVPPSDYRRRFAGTDPRGTRS
jgi:transcriptional regulator GlxA family with amidase domain